MTTTIQSGEFIAGRELRARILIFFFGLLSIFAGTSIASAMSVSLDVTESPPTFVGDVVTWIPTVSDASDGTLNYRFRVRPPGGQFRMVKDYSPVPSFAWTASDREGTYEIEVSVRNADTGEVAETIYPYEFASHIEDGQPVISKTANPLVALYSAPSCPSGSRMRVQFTAPDGFVQTTSFKPCDGSSSMNFYIAGMRAATQYSIHHDLVTGSQSQDGPPMTWTTPEVSLPIAGSSVIQAPLKRITDGILLQSNLQQMTVATDLEGNLVWFYPGDISFLTRPEAGGFFLGIDENQGAETWQQVVREFDLAGNTTLETNAARINEQLAESGMRQINAFHHEARRLPDGKIMLLANTEQVFFNVQGPGPLDVLSDMILVLDRNLQLVWSWDAFDHLSLRHLATLGETCTQSGGGCPPFYLMEVANDWLHGNSLQLTPDGSILYSIRHQDWLVKIDYANGAGSGDIMWRLGKDGDFQINSADPNPWFSHQHDASLNGDLTLTVFDDGNVRQAVDPGVHSRGQVLKVDEANRVVDLIVNADLGAYSFALGSAQRLPNGGYHFDLGWINGDGLGSRSRSVEVDSSGKIVYAIETQTPEYRSFRMRDLYTP